MVQTIENISLLSWQPTLLAWSVGGAIILLCVLMVRLFFFAEKKTIQKRIKSIFKSLILAFCILAIFSNVLAISLIVDMKLGWKFSVLAGGSLIVGSVSIIAMIGELFAHKLSIKRDFYGIFMFLSGVLLLSAAFGLVKLQFDNYDFGKPIWGKGGFPYFSSEP